MTSTIDPSNIDNTYPVPGRTNATDGFRDNFSAIKQNFARAKSDIDSLNSDILDLEEKFDISISPVVVSETMPTGDCRALLWWNPTTETLSLYDDIANLWHVVDDSKVPLAGGTMTGYLILNADPVADLGAATKQFVESQIAASLGGYVAVDATKVPLAGGTMTGALILSSDPSTELGAATKQYADTKVPLAGGTMTGSLILNADPVTELGAATKQYVDFVASSADNVARGGDTMTGALILNADPVENLGAATKQYVDSQSALSGAPSGAVMYFARNTAPDGWLKANGAAVSRTTYSNLFSAIGIAFGNGDGATTFNLPDLRGEFIRAWDDGKGTDAGRTFGSLQGDTIRNITGNFVGHKQQVASHVAGAFYSGADVNVPVDPDPFQNAGRLVYLDASRVVPTSTENRPKNIALLACIKF